MANSGSYVGPQKKYVSLLVVTDNGCRFPCRGPPEYKQAPKHVLLFFLDLRSDIVDMIRVVVLEKETSGIMTCRMNN